MPVTETISYNEACSADDTFTEFEKNLDTREIGKPGKNRKGGKNGTQKVMIVESIEIWLPSTLGADDEYVDVQITTKRMPIKIHA